MPADSARATLLATLLLSLAACTHSQPADRLPEATPPRSPALSAGLCPLIHCDTYQSDALPVRGPDAPSHVLGDDEIDLYWTSPIGGGLLDYTYPDGTVVFWVSKVDRVIKLTLDDGRLSLLQELRLPEGLFPYFSGDSMRSFVEDLDELPVDSKAYRAKASQWRGYQTEGLRAYYAMLSRQGILFVGGYDRIVAYADEVPGRPDSPIIERAEYVFDPGLLNGGLAVVIGIGMTFDGYILVVTLDGTVIAVSQDLQTAHYYRLGSEQIWNSVAVDEQGGVYVAGNRRLHKLIWTGKGFSDRPADGAWVEAYEVGPLDDTPARNQRGTGTTPALMGLESDPDQFVVIADAADVNNLVLYWRDEIPQDWRQLPGTTSRRIAGKLPVDFGFPDIGDSYSENSAVILGYGAVLANNQLRNGEPAFLDNQLRLTDPKVAPLGVQKFEWDPETRVFRQAWVRQDVSNPNSTPVVSSVDRQINLAAQRDGKWVFETLDWDTGQTRARYELGASQRFNPIMLAVQLLPDGDPIYSTFGGVLHLDLAGR